MGDNMSWLLVDNNCGTGAGGFKPGNTCASGKEIAEDATSLANKLLPGGTVSRHASYKNNLSIAYPSMTPNEANLRRLEVETRLDNLGFTRTVTRDDGSSKWEHAQGHEVEVMPGTNWGSRTRNLYTHIIYAPKENREGVQVSREARDTTNTLLRTNFEASWYIEPSGEEAVVQGMLGDFKSAKEYHEKAIRWLSTYRQDVVFKQNKQAMKNLNNAISMHGIARDWYMEKLGVQNAADNCGTGAGGFKKGNTCASGKEVATDVGELTKVLGLTGEPQVHLDNNQSMTYRLGGLFNPNKAKAVHDNILRKALGVGFKPTSDSDHGNDLANWRTTTLEHSHGHVVNIVTQTPTRHQEGRVTTYVYYIPKEDREGLALSKEALDTTYKAFKGNPSHHEMEAEAAVEDARMRDHKGARRYHEKMIRAHTEKAGEIQLARTTLGKGKVYEVDLVKLHKDAAAAHGIARDWYMERMGVQNRGVWNNCGTGKGGFKPGNTCASGRGQIATSVNDLISVLNLPATARVDHLGSRNDYPNSRVVSLSNSPENLTRVRQDWIKSLTSLGFEAAKPRSRRQEIDQISEMHLVMEHPQGHIVGISRRPINNQDSLSAYVTFIPPDKQEGFIITRDTRAATSQLPEADRAMGHTEDALDSAMAGNLYETRIAHDKAIQALRDYQRFSKRSKTVAKQVEDAIGLHRIARDWYHEQIGDNWEPIGNNCGTGAGGFKKGNTCASGQEVGDGTVASAAAAVGLDNPMRLDMGVSNRVYQNFKAASKSPKDVQALKSLLSSVKSLLSENGFNTLTKNGRIYSHSHGHTASISDMTDSKSLTPSFSVYFTYIPKEWREGYVLSKDADEASRKLAESLGSNDLLSTGLGDAEMLYGHGALNAHGIMMRLHEEAAQRAAGNSKLAKAHREAAGIHGIARDWYMDKLGVQNKNGTWNNCGTGAGGFKKGNTCASGGGEEVADSLLDLARKVGAKGTLKKSTMSPNIRYVEQDMSDRLVPQELARLEENLRVIGMPLVYRTGIYDPRSATYYSAYEHKHGHLVEVQVFGTTRPTDPKTVLVTTVYVPKEHREGLMLSKDAQEAVNKATNDRYEAAMNEAAEAARSGDYKRAKESHERVIEDLTTRYAKERTRSKVSMSKELADAVALNRIARDWYMEKLGVQNCSWAKVL